MKKILVIQQKMIGDVLASTVICRSVKQAFPDGEVHYMVYPNTVPVVENNPFIDKLVIFDPKQIRGFSKLKAFGETLKSQKYDAVIDAYGKWESVIPAYFSNAPIRIGNKKWYTSLFYSKTVVPEKNVSGSAIRHRLQLAEAFTGKPSAVVFPKIYLTDVEISSAKQQISQRLDVGKPIIMISVLGSDDSKSLPVKQMAQTLDIIATSPDVQLLFNFMPDQQPQAKAIFDACKVETQRKILLDFYTKGLREFLGILSQCDALIGNEGGAVNMAKALDIPTFTLFSPWISKTSWNMLGNDETHVDIHLKDYFPQIYGDQHPKRFKPQAHELYKKLSPELFGEKLQKFVATVASRTSKGTI